MSSADVFVTTGHNSGDAGFLKCTPWVRH